MRVSPPRILYDDGLPTPRRYWAITAMGLAVAMAVLDSTIANVALPSIARDMAASPTASIWIVNAYQIAVLVSLLPLASLGEVVGYRRISQAGIVLFTLASFACALAPTLPLLCVARVAQGFGGAAIMGVNGALVRFTYPHRMLGRGIGITAMVTAVSSAVGPTVASAILSVAHWRWLFGVNVPIGLVTVVIAEAALPFNAKASRQPNLAGVALYAGALGLLVTGAQALAQGAAMLSGALQMSAGAACAVLLVLRERRRTSPLLPFDLLALPIFSLSILTSICSFMAQALALISLPFRLQHGGGYSAVETGLLMTPWPLTIAVAAPLAGRLSDRWPAAVLGAAGLATLSLGLLLLAWLPAHPPPAAVIWRMVLCGTGFGLFQTPNNRVLLGSAPRSRAGAAGGMLGTARLTGQSLGAVCVALCFARDPATGAVLALTAGGVFAGTAALASLSRVVHRHQGLSETL